MSAHTDFKFHPHITQVGCYWGQGGHTELYLLQGERLAIVDTGVSYTPEQYLAPALAAIGRTLAEVDLIINTHGHHDHAGGNGAVVRASGAEVWMPEPDIVIANDPERQYADYFEEELTLLGREDQSGAALAELRGNMGERFPIARTLQDGDQIDLGCGLAFTVIGMPGHTPGCYSLYLEREGLLIAGDALPGAGSRQGNLPLIYFPDLYDQTLDRVERLDLNCLCLGHHYRSLTLTRESVKWGRDGKRYVRECRAVHEHLGAAIEAAIKAGERTPIGAIRHATQALETPLSLQIDPSTGVAQPQGTAALYAQWKRLNA